MSDINDEMKVTADYAISIAKERYGIQLDYSEDSLVQLDKLLEKIYWGFSSRDKEEGEGGLIFNTAIIWGSYIGEYMRLKWGGTWIYKGTERRISITSIEFSPISLVYQKITDHPEYSVDNFVLESKKVIYASVIHPKKSQTIPESSGQPSQPAVERPPRKPIHVDKRMVYITGGVLGLLLVVASCMAGYAMISSGGLPAFGLLAKPTLTNTATAQPVILATATLATTNTPTMTATQLPTYTPIPTRTRRPSPTPTVTYTETPTLTPTETEYIYPTYTRTPRPSPTPVPPKPSNTPISPTNTPVPTNPPPPTDTQQPLVIVSCGVNPNIVPPNQSVTITFFVQFSYYSPGVGFTALNGDNGCSSGSMDSSARAYCDGSSGSVDAGQSVTVSITSSVGDCPVSYSASGN